MDGVREQHGHDMGEAAADFGPGFDNDDSYDDAPEPMEPVGDSAEHAHPQRQTGDNDIKGSNAGKLYNVVCMVKVVASITTLLQAKPLCHESQCRRTPLSKYPVSVLQGYSKLKQALTGEESRDRQTSETRMSPWTRTLQETCRSAPSGRASLAGGSLVTSPSMQRHAAGQVFAWCWRHVCDWQSWALAAT